MIVECYLLIAWVALLSIALVAFSITLSLKYYGLISRPSRDVNIMFLACFILIAWVTLISGALVAFGIYGC